MGLMGMLFGAMRKSMSPDDRKFVDLIVDQYKKGQISKAEAEENLKKWDIALHEIDLFKTEDDDKKDEDK